MPSSVSRVRVRYAETDKMGVVYYANYFVWFEVARAELLRSLGWSYLEMEHAGVALPVIEARCAYHRSALYDDELDVKAEGRMISPVRMQFDYEVVRRQDSVLAASGRRYGGWAPPGAIDYLLRLSRPPWAFQRPEGQVDWRRTGATSLRRRVPDDGRITLESAVKE